MAGPADDLEIEESGTIPEVGGGVIMIGRAKYAVGLSWQLSPTGQITEAAREAARESRVPMDFFAVRPGNKTGRPGQFGLSVKGSGHKAGMPSAALSLASDQPGSWAGAFRLPEGIWLCVCRDDLITPDGDVLYLDDTLARERLVGEINQGGLQQVYAPEEWHVPNGDSIPLPLLLKGRAQGNLRAVKFSTTQIAVVGVIVVLALAAWWAFSRQQEVSTSPHEETAIQQLNKQAVIPNSKLLPTAAAPPAPHRVWEDAPPPQRFLNSCYEFFQTAPANAVGWKRGDVSCADGGISIQWIREGGVGDLPPNMTGTLHASDSSATSSFPIPPLERRGAENLLDPEQVAKISINNDWPAKLSRLPDDPLPPQPDGTPTPPPPWIKEKITISGDTAPWTIQELFQGIPGLVIQSISWSGKNWTTEGIIYENRK